MFGKLKTDFFLLQSFDLKNLMNNKQDIFCDIKCINTLLSLLKPNRVTKRYELIILTSSVKSIIKTNQIFFDENDQEEELQQQLYTNLLLFNKKANHSVTDDEFKQIWDNETQNIYSCSTLHWYVSSDNLDSYLKVIVDCYPHIFPKREEKEGYTVDEIAKMIYVTNRYFYKTFCDEKIKEHKSIFIFKEQYQRWDLSVFVADHEYILIPIIKKLNVQLDYLHLNKNKFQTYFPLVNLENMFAGTSSDPNKFSDILRSMFFHPSIIPKKFSKMQVIEYYERLKQQIGDIFYDASFIKILNTNRKLLSFENGVYDVENNIFRNGIPDDMIDASLLYTYKQYENNDANVTFIRKLFENWFVDANERQKMLGIVAKTFFNNIKEKTSPYMYILRKETSCSGESSFVNLLRSSFSNLVGFLLISDILELDNVKKTIEELEKSACTDISKSDLIKKTKENVIELKRYFSNRLSVLEKCRCIIVYNDVTTEKSITKSFVAKIINQIYKLAKKSLHKCDVYVSVGKPINDSIVDAMIQSSCDKSIESKRNILGIINFNSKFVIKREPKTNENNEKQIELIDNVYQTISSVYPAFIHILIETYRSKYDVE
jgi:hypothetical protein